MDPFDPIDPFLVRLDGFCSRLGDQSDEELDSDDLRLDDRSGEDDGDEVESIVFGEPVANFAQHPLAQTESFRRCTGATGKHESHACPILTNQLINSNQGDQSVAWPV